MCLGVSLCHSSAAKEQILLSEGQLEFLCVYVCFQVLVCAQSMPNITFVVVRFSTINNL